MLNSLDPNQFMAENLSRLGDRVAHLESLPLLTPAPCPSRAVMWHDESIVLTGVAFSKVVSATQLYAMRVFQNPAANGDSFTNGFYLKGGTYTFVVLGESRADSPLIDWYVDNVKVVSLQDWYAASTNSNIEKTASVTVVGDGYHVLKGVVNGKNGSSTNYFVVLTKMYFKPSADAVDI